MIDVLSIQSRLLIFFNSVKPQILFRVQRFSTGEYKRERKRGDRESLHRRKGVEAWLVYNSVGSIESLSPHELLPVLRIDCSLFFVESGS